MTTIPVAASAPVMDGQEDPGEYTGPALDLEPQVVRAGAVLARPASTAATRRRNLGDADVELRQGRRQQRQPVLLHPHPRRLPELRGDADGVRRALAGGLGGDPHRPARQRLAGRLQTRLTRSSSASSRSRTTRPNSNGNGVERPVLGARRRQPPGLRDRAAGGDGRQRPERSGRPGRVHGDVGRLELDDGRPRLRRGRRLQPRGQDPDGGPAVRGRPDLDAHGLRCDEHDRPAALA